VFFDTLELHMLKSVVELVLIELSFENPGDAFESIGG
jgi:hypothetical protein